MAQSEESSEWARPRPRRYPRWQLTALALAEATARRAGGRALFRRRYLAAARVRVRRVFLERPDLPEGLAGCRLVQLSDLHAGPFLGPGDLAEVVGIVRDLRPDFVFLTGDFLSHRVEEALAILPDLASLSPRVAGHAVFGNHDYRQRREGLLERALASVGFEVLRNSCRRHHLGTACLAVVGLEDLEESRVVDLAKARADVQPGDLEVVLSHHPRAALSLARPGCAAVFSGHTHGGGLSLGGWRSIGPAHPGSQVRLGPTRLIVNAGVGTLGLPTRFGVPGEIVLAELKRGESTCRVD